MATNVYLINWKSLLLIVSKLWASPDGSLVLQSVLDRARTALDLRPTKGIPVYRGAKAELVLYRASDESTNNFERINFSAMNDDEASYRIGIERGGSGAFRELWFCFEDVTPGVADCKMKITIDGVFVRSGQNWVKIGD